VNVKDIDASALAEGAPPSRLTARLEASVVSRPAGKLAGSFDLDSREGEVSRQLVPAARVRGTFTERSARGSAQIAERGAPTTVSFSIDPREGGAAFTDLALALETTVPDLGGVARIGPVGHGRAHVVVDAAMDLETKRFSANAAADVSGLDVKGVRLSRVALAAEAEGPLASPRVRADLRGVGCSPGGTGSRASACAPAALSGSSTSRPIWPATIAPPARRSARTSPTARRSRCAAPSCRSRGETRGAR
jgi:hypothetical protein